MNFAENDGCKIQIYLCINVSSWVEGYKWFQDTLVDADVAINAMMWQNGGMSGLDQGWIFM